MRRTLLLAVPLILALLVPAAARADDCAIAGVFYETRSPWDRVETIATKTFARGTVAFPSRRSQYSRLLSRSEELRVEAQRGRNLVRRLVATTPEGGELAGLLSQGFETVAIGARHYANAMRAGLDAKGSRKAKRMRSARRYWSNGNRRLRQVWRDDDRGQVNAINDVAFIVKNAAACAFSVR